MQYRHPKPQNRATAPKVTRLAAVLVLASSLAACAGNPLEIPDFTGDGTAGNEADQEAQTSTSARIVFHQNSFYTQVETSPTNSCAGDIRTFYKTLDLNAPGLSTDSDDEDGFAAGNDSGYTGAIPFGESALTAGESARPAFIKNVAVDMTDANAALRGNNAKSCALSESVIPTSNCATFDFGAIGGIPTSLGGTLILIGGVQGTNWSGISPIDSDTWEGVTPPSATRGLTVSCGAVREPASLPSAFGGDAGIGVTACSQSLFALGVDSIPAVSLSSAYSTGNALAPGLEGPPESGENISSWANLIPDSSSSSADDAPGGRAGASVAYSTGSQKLVVFGGSAVISGLETEGTSQDTLETWVYNLKDQTWELKSPTVTASQDILKMTDFGDTEESAGTEITSLLSRQSGARAYFGYVPVPFNGLENFASDNGDINGKEDRTERIWIVGGSASGIERYMTRKFNPTFGPEFQDALNDSDNDLTVDDIGTGSGAPVQWAAAYPLQLLSNASTGSYFRPDYSFDKDGDGADDDDEEPQWFGAARFRTNGNIGSMVTAGGFDAEVTDHSTPSSDTTTFYYAKRYSDAGNDTRNGIASTFLSLPNLLTGERVSPIEWKAATDAGPIAKWFGAPLLVAGLWLEENDYVYVGGTTCPFFMADSTLAGDCDFDNAGAYLRLGSAEDLNTSTIPELSLNAEAPATPPISAGMSGARGYDTATTPTPIVVAWGGMEDATDPNAGNIHILRDTGGDDTDIGDLSWTELDASDSTKVSGDLPPVLTASQMVYSHVTGKFYIFGGYQATGTVGSNGDTYELTITGEAGSYTAVWRKLDSENGLTCTPSCPTARRGHGMTEVNYNAPEFANQDDFFATTQCTAAAPCSFAIFMEGGTSDGSTLLADRWMFDPTAHGGAGHWQQVGDFPPRKLASMAAVTFESLGGGQKNWAVLFGGESGLDSPEQVQSGKFMVPPTFGDTMIYDFSSNSWNRMKILGQGRVEAAGGSLNATSLSELEKRQSYIIKTNATSEFQRAMSISSDLTTITTTTESTIADLAPPALSGAMMITRTQPRALHGASTSVTPLKIPELYLIGGRKKDGKPQALQEVWKLCVASPGERIPITGVDIDDASCDAFDETDNADSPAPLTEYAGRWLHKKTEAGPQSFDQKGAYLAAGAYDSQFDRIVVYGGINSHDGANHTGITDTADTDTDGTPNRTLNDEILEYTPPSKINTVTASEYHGVWNRIPHCRDSSATLLAAPTPRYGHSLSYDPIQKRLILSGGFDISGSALAQTITTENPAGSYSAPEVWTGTRIVESGTYFTDTDEDGTPEDVNEDNPCYAWRKITVFGNSTEIVSALPPQTSIGLAASVFIPPTGYNTGYYSMFDEQCVDQGPFAGTDAITSKQFAGGVYIDLDRTALGERENLALNLTYLPLGTKNQRPDGQLYSREESAYFKVHLLSTGESLSDLLSALQPRHLWYTNETDYPKIVHSIEVLAPPDGSPRTEQIILPLGLDASIDRIRIERVSGSGILIDAALYRLGPK